MKQLTLLFLLLFTYLSNAQNLVLNPGFEQHDAKAAVAIFDSKTVANWSRPTGHVILLSEKYQPSPTEKKRGYDLEKFPPFAGKAHVLLNYGLSVPGYKITAGAHAQTKLSEPLKKGEIYSIRFAVKVNKTSGIETHPQFAAHFGISFSVHPFQRKKGSGLLNDYSPFLLKNHTLNEWTEVQYYLQPTIDLEYLAIGAFENFYHPTRFASGSENGAFEFFVDDISVEKMEVTNSYIEETAIHFPFWYPPFQNEKREIKTVYETINFDSGLATLSIEDQKKLDALILKMNRNTAYKISGHTDNVGNENDLLSQKRAATVKDYLVENGDFIQEQFTVESLGDSKPIYDNETKTGRQQNRRVTIEDTGFDFYKNLLLKAQQTIDKNQPDSTLYFLQKLIQIEEFDKITLLNDPYFESLHTHPKWKAIRFFIKDSYKIYELCDLAFAWDELFFQPKSPEKLKAATKLLDKHGFISPIKIGTRAALAQFEILSKSGDEALRKKYLAAAKKVFVSGGFPEDFFQIDDKK